MASCPRCGALLIEDAWEESMVLEDSITLDVFEAFICSQYCGYYERLEEEDESGTD
jgi:hypothetical protein